ncbi:hypothetical protein Dsin_023860 [Dipteronia sinensis]|uniref:RRM domain-containing protein n=1 Tax=Dipteronia sinensis TaxID=43782 RepID=A0AAE0A453_9ROSI|nr:hypothetical protein Dsin_023860 [Dipteronia sinensis]
MAFRQRVNVRERDSRFHVHGWEAQVQANRKDFRDKLVSVFVDNLSPVVDLAGLWGIFKPFGVVRDVFFSLKMNTRTICYAFIRFTTIEEARKVVDKVNGMHVYGWPITAKVADYGWDK